MRAAADEALHYATANRIFLTASELREWALAWWGLLAIPVAGRLGLGMKGRHPTKRAAWDALVKTRK